MWTVTLVFLARLMAAITRGGGAGTPGPLFNVWLGLYQAPTSPITPQSTLANITEASYDGYSRQLVTWFPAFVAQAGPELLTAQDLFFSPTDALVVNMITGVFIADAFYGGNLLAAAVLPLPGVQLTGPGRAIKVQPQYSQQFLQIYGSPAVVD